MKRIIYLCRDMFRNAVWVIVPVALISIGYYVYFQQLQIKQNAMRITILELEQQSEAHDMAAMKHWREEHQKQADEAIATISKRLDEIIELQKEINGRR